jgi:hypothetical protein
LISNILSLCSSLIKAATKCSCPNYVHKPKVILCLFSHIHKGIEHKTLKNGSIVPSSLLYPSSCYIFL